MLQKGRNLLRQPILNHRLRQTPATMETVTLDGGSLDLEKLSLLGSGHGQVELASTSWKALETTRAIVENLSQKDEPVYGINTGFGRFSNVKIPSEKLRDLQYNLIRSHSTGVGKLLPIDPSRRIVALRINTLAKGFSGISLDVVHRLIEFFNSGCVPWIPRAGTVGASGDLVPLAHIGLSVIGEGLVWDPKTKKYEPTAQVFERYGLKKAELRAKDGLSLINGTQFICGVGSCAVQESIMIIKCIGIGGVVDSIMMQGMLCNQLPPKAMFSQDHDKVLIQIFRQSQIFEENHSYSPTHHVQNLKLIILISPLGSNLCPNICIADPNTFGRKGVQIIKSIQAICALSFIALKGHPAAFDERVQLIRIHPGQNIVGEIMRELVPEGSNVENQYDVQDPYSMRCIPQVHGPSLEGILNSKEALEIEMNSGSDNPLVFADREPMIVSGGNFHGEYPAKQLDILAMYTHEIGSLSFMRAKRMMNPHKSLGLPAFLTPNGGKCSGLMTWENVVRQQAN